MAGQGPRTDGWLRLLLLHRDPCEVRCRRICTRAGCSNLDLVIQIHAEAVLRHWTDKPGPDRHSFRPTFAHLEQRMWASHFSLSKQYHSLGCSASVWLPLQLHAAGVEPAGSFACELWGVYQQHSAARRRLETARLRQLRQITGISPAIALPIIWRELMTCSLLAMLGSSEQPAFGTRLLETRAFTGSWPQTPCPWRSSSTRVTGCMACDEHCGLVGYHMQLDLVALHSIDIGDLRCCLAAQLAQPWSGLAASPRTCSSSGARLCTYLQWFACPGPMRAGILRLPLPRKALVCFLRFRTG